MICILPSLPDKRNGGEIIEERDEHEKNQTNRRPDKRR